MKDKKYFCSVALIFLCLFKIYSQVGFSFDTSVFIPEENEYYSSYSYDKRSSVFFRSDGVINNMSLCLVPEIYYDYSTDPKLIFQYFDLSVFTDNFSIGLRKNKFNSNVGNIYATQIPYNVIEKNVSYWNTDFTLPAGFFKFTLQEILDSQNLDLYKAPEWENTVLKIKFDTRKIESSLINNFFYNWNKNTFIYKGQFFANYIFNENINFYFDASSSFVGENKYTILSGVNFCFLTGDFIPSLALEYANVEEENIAGVFVNFNYADCINFYSGLKKNFNIKNHLGFFSEVKFAFEGFAFNVLFNWYDINSVKKYISLGVSLNEK